MATVKQQQMRIFFNSCLFEGLKISYANERNTSKYNLKQNKEAHLHLLLFLCTC